jgi:hypothetical protein
MKNPFDAFDEQGGVATEAVQSATEAAPVPNPFDQFDGAPPAEAVAANAFDQFDVAPLAAGARYDVQAIAETARNGTVPGDVVGAAVRGALSEGALAGAEGVARGTQALSNTLADRIVRANVLGSEFARLGATLGDLERAEMLGSNPTRAAQVQQIRGRMQAIEADKAAALGGAESFQGEQLKPLTRTFAGARQAVRDAFPVSPEFESSLGGQIISGLGQAVGTLPFYLVPVAGGSMSVGQLFQEGYDDAVRRGADEATANKAGAANVPASALDILSDRLVVGRVLKPLKGKMSVGQLARSVAVSSAAEGVTEGAQQAWQNLVARNLVGYDPERQLDDEVINSIIVGAVVGGTVTGVGGAVTNRFAPELPTARQPEGSGMTQPAPAAPPPSAGGVPPAAATAPVEPRTDAEWSAAARAAEQPIALPPSAPEAPAAPTASGSTPTPTGSVPQLTSPMPPPPPGRRPEPTFNDVISGKIEDLLLQDYYFERVKSAQDRWNTLLPDERRAAIDALGIETWSYDKPDGPVFPFSVTPSAFDAALRPVEAQRRQSQTKQPPVEPQEQLPLDQQIANAEMAVTRATIKFRDIGKWKDQKDRFARERWQQAKQQVQATQSQLEELKRKQADAQNTQPSPKPASGTETPPPPSAATAMAPSLPEGAPQRAAVEGSAGLGAGQSVPPQSQPVKPMSRRQMADVRRQIRELETKAQRAAQTSPERAGEFTQEAQRLREQLAQAEANRPTGAAPAVGVGPDGNPDLLSDIAEYVGRIRTTPPEGVNAIGGEYDGWDSTLNEGAARLLRGSDRGMKPDEVVEILNNSAGYKFDGIAALQEAIRKAVAQRRKVGAAIEKQNYQQRVEAMATTDTRQGRRADLRPKEPTTIQDIGEGGSFTLNREKFSVVDIKDDPDSGTTVYVIQDGHRFEVPYDTPIFADKGSIEPGKTERTSDPFDWPTADEPSPGPAPTETPPAGQLFPEGDMPFNLSGEEQSAPTAPPEQGAQTAEMFGSETRGTAPTDMDRRNERERSQRGAPGAAGSTPFSSPPPVGMPFTRPPRNSPPPPPDPSFTQLPIELPEAVQFFNIITLGKYPKIREVLRTLRGRAAGVFRYREGQIDSGEIELRADQFRLLSQEEKQALLADAVEWAKQMVGTDDPAQFQQAVKARFEELVAAAEEESIKAGPRRALAVFWHEIGHLLDFIPQATIKRGNILGRLASLNHYFKEYIGDRPGVTAEPPTTSERAKIYAQAERELQRDVQTIVETIRREEPVYREIAITAEQITDIVKNAARADYPGFYDWFAKLDRRDKADVLRKAMKGVIDERAKQFNRREPTGETRIIEETVTRSIGEPPTKAQIEERFKALFYAELERRGLVSETQIREELSRAIAWWRGVDKIPDYYKTSVEMWADAMSIFFNNPRALAQLAPRFYFSFMQWMAAKPGLREEYDKLQRDIASGQIYKDRVQNLRDSWQRDAENAILLDEAGTKTTLASYLDYARLLMDRMFGPIERKIAKQPGATGPRALAAMGNYRYRTTAWEAYALDLRNQVEVPLADANLTHDDLAEYMFHKRITEGSRRNLANPLGWNPKNSRERLAEMERDLGPQRWAALVATQEAQRRIYQRHVVQLLHRAGVLSPKLAQAIDAEFFYAPFNKARVFTGGNTDSIEALLKLNYGNDAAGAIYGQIGNLGEIRSPYVQMQHRAFGLMSMAHKQLALKSVIGYLQENDPLAIVEAPLRFNGRFLEPRAVNNDEVSTLYVVDHGKVRAYYVKRIIAEMFSKGSVIEMRLAGLAHRVLGLPKAMLTELNPGFWPVAFFKDIGNALVQLPGGYAGLVGNIPRAYQAARATFTGRPDPLATRVLERMMVISRADSRGEHLGHADEMTRILMRLGKSPVAWNAEVGKIERALSAFWQGWARQGQILERTVKIASMMAVDQRFPHLPEGEKQQLVRELGGSPDFLSKGRAARTVELMFGMMFFNAWKEAARSQFRAIKRDPRGYWTKVAATVGVASAVLWAFESGLLATGGGEDEENYRDMLRSIPERDKLRGYVIPFGWVDRPAGKVAYLVLPFPDNVRWVHALFRKSLQTSGGNPVGAEGLGSALEYQAGDLPGQNPFFTAIKEYWAYYVQGRNPYDSFTGRGALDQTAVDARQADAELAKRTVSNVTGGIAYRFKPSRPGEEEAATERFLNLPFVSNLLGRWVRVSNRGLDDAYRGATESVAQREAALRLIGEEMISRTLKGEPWASEQTSLLSESPYLAQYLVDAMPRLAMQADSPFLRQMQQAQTQAQKLAIVELENERQRARQERIRSSGGIRNPIPLPPEPAPQR